MVYITSPRPTEQARAGERRVIVETAQTAGGLESRLADRLDDLRDDTGFIWKPAQVAIAAGADTSGDWPVSQLHAIVIVEAHYPPVE